MERERRCFAEVLGDVSARASECSPKAFQLYQMFRMPSLFMDLGVLGCEQAGVSLILSCLEAEFVLRRGRHFLEQF